MNPYKWDTTVWYRVTRNSQEFRGLAGCQRDPWVWGVTAWYQSLGKRLPMELGCGYPYVWSFFFFFHLTHGSIWAIYPNVMCHLLHHMVIMPCVHLLRCHVASTWSCHVSSNTRRLEKCEIPTVLEFDEIRQGN